MLLLKDNLFSENCRYTYIAIELYLIRGVRIWGNLGVRDFVFFVDVGKKGVFYSVQERLTLYFLLF